jgi:hypothetical protein
MRKGDNMWKQQGGNKQGRRNKQCDEATVMGLRRKHFMRGGGRVKGRSSMNRARRIRLSNNAVAATG